MSDDIHEKICNVLELKKIFMTSYVIWVVARSDIYPGLNTNDRLAEASGDTFKTPNCTSNRLKIPSKGLINPSYMQSYVD